NIYNNQGTIQDAISKVGGVSYPDCCVWSSSEIDDFDAWHSYLGGRYGLDYYPKDDYFLDVRPVLEF
uniref:hypothetical protein n=1 Tax=Candidatus Scatocola faecigallinarum TaxID=2840916 RepID=UPI0040292262